MRRGEFVYVSFEGQTLEAMVTLASGGPVGSIAVMFDGMLDGCMGMMPLLYEHDKGWVNIMSGNVIQISKQNDEGNS
jgi:hypothetical protein